MKIEILNDEIIIRLPKNTDLEGVQRLLDFLMYKQVTEHSEATQEQIDALSSEVNKSWWEKNKNKFLHL